MNAKAEPIVALRYIMQGLGREKYGTQSMDVLLKKHKPDIIATMPYGKGTMRMIRKTDADKIIALEKQVKIEESPEIVHTGAIETKLDRVEAEIQGLHQAMGEFTKASNLIADRLNKVLQQLGVS